MVSIANQNPDGRPIPNGDGDLHLLPTPCPIWLQDSFRAAAAPNNSPMAPAPAPGPSSSAAASFLHACCASVQRSDACYRLLLPYADSFRGSLARVARTSAGLASARQHAFSDDLARLKQHGTGAGAMADMALVSGGATGWTGTRPPTELDRLGFDQSSKAIEWLIRAAAIDELPSLDCSFALPAPSPRPPAGGDADAEEVSTSDTSKGSVLSLANASADTGAAATHQTNHAYNGRGAFAELLNGSATDNKPMRCSGDKQERTT
ncbi:hypothetical protein EJB05_05513, partial [Eragrostis curvula]